MFALDAGIPVLTLAWVLDHILDCLIAICNEISEIFQPHQYAAWATTIQAFAIRGAVGVCLTDPN
jgi:hypothetical protein